MKFIKNFLLWTGLIVFAICIPLYKKYRTYNVPKTSPTITTNDTPSSPLNFAQNDHIPRPLQPQEIKNIIFDFHGVLFTISQKRAADHLGMFDLLAYTMSGHNVEDLEGLIFDILYQYPGYPPMTPQPDELVPMHNGRVLPPVMCTWMRGSISSAAIIQSVTTLIEKLYQDNYFKSRAQKKLVLKIINLMFDPEIRASLYKPLKKGVAIMRECKEQGHKIYLMSNMDNELIPLLQKKYPEIFQCFDGMLISADIGMIKPDVSIYNHLIKKFGLDPATCYLLDDQKENVQGAKKVGFKALQHNQRKTKKTRRKLDKWGILPLAQAEVPETQPQHS